MNKRPVYQPPHGSCHRSNPHGGVTPLFVKRNLLRALSLASFSLLTSCAGPIQLYLPEPIRYPTSNGFTEMMETWDGQSTALLVKKWGRPESKFDVGDGTVIWTYSWDRSYRTPTYSVTTTENTTATTQYNSWSDTATTTAQPGKSTTTVHGGNLVSIYCNVEFHIRGSKITYWRWKGNDCKRIPKVKPYQCTLPGRPTRIAALGRATKNGVYGEAVKLFTDEVFVFSDDVDFEAVPSELPVKTKVLTCYNSGLGPYLYTYPPPSNKIYKGSFR